jgi:putative SOS response-associated peptidase YedK
MCGRFVRKSSPQVYGTLFGVSNVPDLPSYNIAPTQPVAVVRMVGDHKACALMRWGLIPLWAKHKKTSFINARADTLFEKPAFRSAVKRRRCLILADGYYEWQPLGPKQKQPYYFHRKDDSPVAFAGIWECWKGAEQPLESCAIITTDANDLSRPIHDRMPAILCGADAEAWLDPRTEEPAILLELLRPFATDAMACDRVGPLVNSVKNNGPGCIEVVG